MDKDLDLIEISPNTNPPVCKIMSFSKFKYDQSKKEKNKSKNKELKEIRFKPFIDIGDYNNKMSKIRKFLREQRKVRVTIRSKGRSTMENANVLAQRIITDLEDIAKLEVEPKKEGRALNMQFKNI